MRPPVFPRARRAAGSIWMSTETSRFPSGHVLVYALPGFRSAGSRTTARSDRASPGASSPAPSAIEIRTSPPWRSASSSAKRSRRLSPFAVSARSARGSPARSPRAEEAERVRPPTSNGTLPSLTRMNSIARLAAGGSARRERRRTDCQFLLRRRRRRRSEICPCRAGRCPSTCPAGSSAASRSATTSPRSRGSRSEGSGPSGDSLSASLRSTARCGGRGSPVERAAPALRCRGESAERQGARLARVLAIASPAARDVGPVVVTRWASRSARTGSADRAP